MAGAIKKMAEYLGLVDDDGRYDEEYYDDETRDAQAGDQPDDDRGAVARADDSRTVAARSERTTGMTNGTAAVATFPERRAAPVAVAQPAKERAELSRITTLHPRTYNEARTVGEHFRDGTPVIMNLTSMDDQDAKRLVDFAAGLIFGLRGSIEKITTKVFLLSPANVEVTAEDKRRIVESEFFNQS
jgi:cell division inhibitor SepF